MSAAAQMAGRVSVARKAGKAGERPATSASQEPTRAQAKARRRMEAAVSSLQSYMATYSEQPGYAGYSDRCYIDDVLYGLGRALEPKLFGGNSQGFDAFKERLSAHLQKGTFLEVGAVAAVDLADGARIERTSGGEWPERWVVTRRGKTLDCSGRWLKSCVGAVVDANRVPVQGFDSAEVAFQAWRKVVDSSGSGSITRAKRPGCVEVKEPR